MCFTNTQSLVSNLSVWNEFKKAWTVEFWFVKLLIYWILYKRMLVYSHFVDYKYNSWKMWKILHSCYSKLSCERAKQPLVWFSRTAFEIQGVNPVDMLENIPVFKKDHVCPSVGRRSRERKGWGTYFISMQILGFSSCFQPHDIKFLLMPLLVWHRSYVVLRVDILCRVEVTRVQDCILCILHQVYK